MDDDLSHGEFLLRLCSDEVERREQKQRALRLRRANFDGAKRLEAFEWKFNPKIPKAKIVDLATCSFVDRRVLAQVDIPFSNSMIEAWWRQLKHQWLFLNQLDNIRRVQRLVAFYVREHNSVIPHSAFKGQTPDEIYFGTGDVVPIELKKAKERARMERLEENRALSCSRCT